MILTWSRPPHPNTHSNCPSARCRLTLSLLGKSLHDLNHAGSVQPGLFAYARSMLSALEVSGGRGGGGCCAQ